MYPSQKTPILWPKRKSYDPIKTIGHIIFGQVNLSHISTPICYLLILWFLIPSCLNAEQTVHSYQTKQDTMRTTDNAVQFIRGIESNDRNSFNPLHILWKATTFIPRQVLHVIHTASGYGIRLISNQKFIDTIEDFLFNDEKKLVWYPLFDFTSSFRPRYGLNFLIRRGNWETLTRGNFADQNKFKIETILSYRFQRANTIYRMTLSGLYSIDDDKKYFGIGSDSRDDERSYFIPNPANNFGVYYQERQKIQFITGIRSSDKWEYFFMTFFQKRKIQDLIKSDEGLGKSFDLENLPGFQNGIMQWYNEFSIRLDTRNKNKYGSTGFRLEGYLG